MMLQNWYCQIHKIYDSEPNELIQTLTQYGNFIELDVTTNAEQLVSWADTFHW